MIYRIFSLLPAKYKKLDSCRVNSAKVESFIFGAWGGNRTRTTLKSQDFKSCASTYSATQAREKDYHDWIGTFKLAAMILGNCVNILA